MGKKAVLVSGGAGYIGSHTAVELINAGLNVVVADNLSNSDMSGVEGVRKITGVDVPFINVDCCDKEAFRKVFEEYEFDSVIHFAAFKAVGESVAEPMKYYRNNLLSFMNIIQDYHAISCDISTVADYVFTITPNSPRALSADEYSECYRALKVDTLPCSDVKNAFNLARGMAKERNLPLVILGSLYTYAEINNCIKEKN